MKLTPEQIAYNKRYDVILTGIENLGFKIDKQKTLEQFFYIADDIHTQIKKRKNISEPARSTMNSSSYLLDIMESELEYLILFYHDRKKEKNTSAEFIFKNEEKRKAYIQSRATSNIGLLLKESYELSQNTK